MWAEGGGAHGGGEVGGAVDDGRVGGFEGVDAGGGWAGGEWSWGRALISGMVEAEIWPSGVAAMKWAPESPRMRFKTGLVNGKPAEPRDSMTLLRRLMISVFAAAGGEEGGGGGDQGDGGPLDGDDGDEDLRAGWRGGRSAWEEDGTRRGRTKIVRMLAKKCPFDCGWAGEEVQKGLDVGALYDGLGLGRGFCQDGGGMSVEFPERRV